MPVTFPVSSSTGNEAGEYIKEVIKTFKGLRLFVLSSKLELDRAPSTSWKEQVSKQATTRLSWETTFPQPHAQWLRNTRKRPSINKYLKNSYFYIYESKRDSLWEAKQIYMVQIKNSFFCLLENVLLFFMNSDNLLQNCW